MLTDKASEERINRIVNKLVGDLSVRSDKELKVLCQAALYWGSVLTLEATRAEIRRRAGGEPGRKS